MLIEDKQIKNAKEVEEFIKTKFKLPSIDNINAFLNEIKELEDEDLSLDDIIKYMNINLNNSSTPDITPDTDSISIAIDEDDLDDLLMEAA